MYWHHKVDSHDKKTEKKASVYEKVNKASKDTKKHK